MILKGWKEISKHLGCAVRSAQRWEGLGLPVRRPSAHQRSAVLALAEELDAWVSEQAGGIEALPGKTTSQRFPYRILIADDDEALLIKLGARLTREGYTVRTARDGFEALAVMRDAVPDLVICGLNMPRMSGFELLSVIRRRFPALGVIATSDEFLAGTSPTVICDRYIQNGPNLLFEVLEAVRELLTQSPLRTQPAKAGIAPVWIPRSTNGYVVLSCVSCLRSFSVRTGAAVIGKDAMTPCIHCGVEMKYHIDDSALPIKDEIADLIEAAHKRIASSRALIRASRESEDAQ